MSEQKEQRELIQSWVKRANALAVQGRFDEAVNVYEEVLKYAPGNLDIRENIISIATKKGDYRRVLEHHMKCAEIFAARGDGEAAIERYQTVLRLEDTVQAQGVGLGGGDDLSTVKALVDQVRPFIYKKIGEYHLERGNIDLALQHLRKSNELRPGDWSTHMALGRAYMARGRDKEAIGEFQEVIRLEPQEAAYAYELLGEIFIRQGDRQPDTISVWFHHAAEGYKKKGQERDALRCYERILEFLPQKKDILYATGDLCFKLGLTDKGVATYKVLGEIYEKERLLDKVIQVYETVAQKDPNSQWAVQKLINIYEHVLKVNPSNMSVRERLIGHLEQLGTGDLSGHYLALAQGQVERGMLDKAVKNTRKLLEKEPGNVTALKMLGDIYLKKDMQAEALEMYQQVVKQYQLQGDEKKAIEFQQELVKRFPAGKSLHFQIARTLTEQGAYDKALAEVESILKQEPEEVEAWELRARLLVHLERWDEAVASFQRVVMLDPTRRDIRKSLIEILVSRARLDDASQEISNIPPDDPLRVELRCKLIETYFRASQLDKVERELEFLPSDDENRLRYYKELVKSYLSSGLLDKAFEGLPKIPKSDRERNSLVAKALEIPLAKGELDVAARAIDSLPEDDPLRLSFQRRLVASYLDQGRLDEASSEVAKLPVNDESRAGFVRRLIGGFLQNGLLDKAAREIYSLDEKDPNRNSYMGQLIEAYLSSGALDRAAEEVAKLPVTDEIKPRYHRRIIQAYLNGGRLEEAQRDILALDDSDPEKRSFLRLLIQKFLTLGELDRVREIVMQMPDDMEEKQQYLDGLVHNYLDSGDLARARQQIYTMADTVAAQGKYEEAERLYREILAYQPADVEVRMRLSQAIASRGHLERAREGMLVLAGRFHREGNVTSAADIYTRILELEPDNLNARFKLGHLWAEQGQTAQALEQFSELAKVYLEQNLPDMAFKVLELILELDPKDMEHRRQLIQLLIKNLRFEEATSHQQVLMSIHLERGEVEDALECVKEIINLQPLNLDLRLDLGMMFLQSGFLEQGQSLLEDLINDCREKEDYERVFKVLWCLVDTFEANEQWETALEYRERIADLYRSLDDFNEAHKQYLCILEGYLTHRHRAAAEPIFVKLIDGFFQNRYVPEGMAKLEKLEENLIDKGQPLMALVVKERIVGMLERLDEWDRSLEMLEAMSRKYLELGEIDGALHFCRRAADTALSHERTEKGIELLFVLAGMLIEHRGLEEARPVLDELKRTAQDNVDYLERLGDVLFQQRQFDEARPIYHEILERVPGRPDALSRIAIIYAREGRLEEAADVAKQIFSAGLIGKIIDEYKKAMGFKDEDAGSHIRLGQFYQQMGFTEAAIEEFVRAMSDPSKVLVAHNQLALCFLQQGYHDLAIRQFNKALEEPGFQEEDFLEIRFNLACAYEEQGDYKEALQAFQECYVIDIRYKDVANRIESLVAKMQLESS